MARCMFLVEIRNFDDLDLARGFLSRWLSNHVTEREAGRVRGLMNKIITDSVKSSKIEEKRRIERAERMAPKINDYFSSEGAAYRKSACVPSTWRSDLPSMPDGYKSEEARWEQAIEPYVQDVYNASDISDQKWSNIAFERIMTEVILNKINCHI